MWVFDVRLERKKRKPSKRKASDISNYLYKAIRIHALLPFIKDILGLKDGIRGKQNCEIGLSREVVITFPAKAIVKNKEA